MRWITRIAAAVLCAALQACVTPPANTPPALSADSIPERRLPVTILVSLDGFRPDYLDRAVTPNLSRLAAGGIHAAMRPSFPSKTFPNHWTLVTGLRPDRNGIVANTMEDATRPGETFTMQTDDPFWWNAAEPIWVTAERAGIRTATMFWPGSNVAFGGTKSKSDHNAAIGGMRPADWAQFDIAITRDQRVDGVIDWLRRPAATRPRFVTLYIDDVDTAGHDFGPDDARTTAVIGAVDTTIGRLVAGLRELHQPANLVIVADHGMAATSSTRTVALDRIASPADYRIIESGPYAGLAAIAGHEAALERDLLRPHPHIACWRKSAIPPRFHYGLNPRVPPYLCLADIGWQIAKTTPDKTSTGGTHGYDNFSKEMAALFIANGPAIQPLGALAPFDNVDVAPLLRDLIGLPSTGTADGDDAPFKPALHQ